MKGRGRQDSLGNMKIDNKYDRDFEKALDNHYFRNFLIKINI